MSTYWIKVNLCIGIFFSGQIKCLTFECRYRLKSGCSHYKYSLDTCCDVDSVCGPIAECKLDGETYREGDRMYPMSTCEKCICDEGFKKDAPFCRPRKCFDQATHHLEISKYGAPVFLGNEKCCPTTWTVDDGEKIIKMNPNLVADSELFCKFGDRSITLGYGFEKSIKFHSRNVAVKCECSIPPFIFCVEK